MWEFKAWSSASIRTLPAVAMAPLPPVHAPYSKMGRPSIQTTPQVGKKKTCGPHHHLSPPSVSLSTTTGADKMGE